MLMPHPTTLRRLLEEYETLLATETLTEDTALAPRLQDLAYTLCVSTGTREITHALKAAYDYLDETADSIEGADVVTGATRVRATIPSGRIVRTAGDSVLPQG
jgi:hypothetical protein